jgi:hypothetical protein
MKIYKKTIVWMILVCIIFLSLASILEFNLFIKVSYHKDYYENILLGAFASGLLVLIPSIVSYSNEKKQYYLNAYSISNKLLYGALEIISYMENYSQDKELVSNTFSAVSIQYDEFISQYSQFTYFFHFSNRDKLIESIVNEITKYILIQEEWLKVVKMLKDNQINLDTYTDCFNQIRREIIDTFKHKFIRYQYLIKKDIEHFMKDKKLKTYIE